MKDVSKPVNPVKDQRLELKGMDKKIKSEVTSSAETLEHVTGEKERVINLGRIRQIALWFSGWITGPPRGNQWGCGWYG